jgi:hypothetical protein
MTKVEALREEIGTDFCSFATFQVVDALIAAARAEGAEEERKRLMSLLALLVMYEGVVSYSLLAPKEKP